MGPPGGEAEGGFGVYDRGVTSRMGRTVYTKFGFRAEGAAEDLVYEVNEQFRHRDKPAILFMRTGASWRHATLIDGGLK